MKELLYTSSFKKDIKKVSTYSSFKEDLFDKYTEMLAQGQSLPTNTKDHTLSKSSPKRYKGLRDFHLSPDICVLYKQTPDSIIFYRIGKHNNLGLTEKLVDIL